jgi:uncharacterized membrane protein YtjA (UPF0391 family)
LETWNFRFGTALALTQSARNRCGAVRREQPDDQNKKKRYKMLHYALIFFLIAIEAADLGFGGISAASAGIAKILFFLFLVIFLVTLVMGVARRA